MKSVAIAMSTYNGEKYLKEQLDSILRQKDVIVTLFVRDDGSKDLTKSILMEYAATNSNIHLEFGDNIGVGNSFMNLLYSIPDTFDYYAFADQDDIWEDDKLIKAIAMLECTGKYLYASNQECVDKYGNSIELRYKEDCHIHLTPISILSENMLAGCTMVWTFDFFKILVENKKRPSESLLKNRIHDVWLAIVASLYDGILYDNRAFIKYRQHENNVVGAQKTGFVKRIKVKLKKIVIKDLRNGRSKLAKELCEKFREKAYNYNLLIACAEARKLKSKKILIKHSKELCGYTGEKIFGFKMKVLLGVY